MRVPPVAVQQLILSSHFGAVPTFHLSPISLDNPQFVSTSLTLLTLQCCCVISGSSALEPQTLLSICSDELTELRDTFPRLFENSPLALGQSSAIQSLHTSTVFEGFYSSCSPVVAAILLRSFISYSTNSKRIAKLINQPWGQCTGSRTLTIY